MSVLLLTNPYAPQQGQPQAQQSEGRSVAAPGLMPSEGPAAVAPSMATKGSTGGGSATSYGGTGAGAGGFGSTAFSRPNEATPRSVVDARVARSDTPDDAGKSEQAEGADQLRIAPAPSGMPDPLPTSPFLKRTAT